MKTIKAIGLLLFLFLVFSCTSVRTNTKNGFDKSEMRKRIEKSYKANDFLNVKELGLQYLEVVKDDPRIYYDVGYAYTYGLDNPSQGVLYFIKASELEPTSADTLFRVTNCYSRMKKHELTIEWAKKTIEADMNSIWAFEHLAASELALGYKDLAEQDIKKGLAIKITQDWEQEPFNRLIKMQSDLANN
jgi:tetratricopeptide (TPR) repeat protein